MIDYTNRICNVHTIENIFILFPLLPFKAVLGNLFFTCPWSNTMGLVAFLVTFRK